MHRKTTLTKGIRVVTDFMPDVHSASVGFWVEKIVLVMQQAP